MSDKFKYEVNAVSKNLGINLLGSTDYLETITARKEVDLDLVYDRALDIQNNSRDIILTGKEKDAKITGFSSKKGVVTLTDKKGNKPYVMTKHSLAQLCQKIGMNKMYYNTCYDKKAFDLLDENMNYWCLNSKAEEHTMFRIYKDKYVRGVLSDKFTVFDAPDIIYEVMDTVAKERYDLKGALINPERLHLRFTQNRELFDDDDLFGGFTIDSSDVGRKALEIRFFIYKQVCTNGLCIPKYSNFSYRQRHFGVFAAVDFRSNFKVALKGVDSFCESVKDLVLKSKNISVDLTDEDFIKQVSHITTLPVEVLNKKVIPLAQQNYDSTQWGLINAITHYAQSYTLERRLELENTAGRLLLTA